MEKSLMFQPWFYSVKISGVKREKPFEEKLIICSLRGYATLHDFLLNHFKNSRTVKTVEMISLSPTENSINYPSKYTAQWGDFMDK